MKLKLNTFSPSQGAFLVRKLPHHKFFDLDVHLFVGFPLSHYAIMNAFISFNIDHHLKVDAKFIEGNFCTPYA
jgi:hypothetical protein